MNSDIIENVMKDIVDITEQLMSASPFLASSHH